MSQNMVPNNKAMTVVKKSLTAVYGGFLQYDRCCFQRQALHWLMNDCEYFVGKFKSGEPGGAILRSLIMSLFLLSASKLCSFIVNHKSYWWCECHMHLAFKFDKYIPIQVRVFVNFSKVNLECSFLCLWGDLQHPRGRIITILYFWNPTNSLHKAHLIASLNLLRIPDLHFVECFVLTDLEVIDKMRTILA